MQVYSLDENRKSIPAYLAKKGVNYFCIECGLPLRLRGGLHKRLHFYHIEPNPACRLNGKSATHLAIQYHIQELFSEVRLEHPFPEINRIADCFLPSRNLIFEIQCSFISAEEVKMRNFDYAKLGLKVIWILHDQQFNRFRLTAAEQFLVNSPFYYTTINEEGEGMIYSKNRKNRIDLRTEKFDFLKRKKKGPYLKLLLRYFLKFREDT